MIADFLDNYRPGGPFVLTSIVPDGKTETRTFTDSRFVSVFLAFSWPITCSLRRATISLGLS